MFVLAFLVRTLGSSRMFVLAFLVRTAALVPLTARSRSSKPFGAAVVGPGDLETVVGREDDQWFLLEPDKEVAPFARPIPVHYSMVDPPGDDRRDPVVCLHGFGVGEFHWAANVPVVATAAGKRRVYAMDWIGQGRSWPDDPKGLSVGADTWIYQLEQFLERVVLANGGEKAVLAGNSLGGFLAAVLASRRPDLVKGLCLLNAAPFWGFFPRFLDILWDAKLPAPGLASSIGSTWFDVLRDRQTIESLLRDVYAADDTVTDDLIDKILAATRTEFGPDVFTSILFSPPPLESFDQALHTASFDNDIPVALVYGKDDPWVFPAWGQRAFRKLDPQRSLYYELSSTGHCPNDESPIATNLCLADILDAFDTRRPHGHLVPSPRVGLTTSVQEAPGREVIIYRVDGKPRNLVESGFKLAWG